METIPTVCFYTDLPFADNIGEVNPNDPYKRTVDHKKPVLICFLAGTPIEEAARPENLSFVLRCVNTAKANTRHEDFLPIAKIIKQELTNESKSSS